MPGCFGIQSWENCDWIQLCAQEEKQAGPSIGSVVYIALEFGDMGGCSLLVRTAPRAKLNTPPVSIRSGAIQNHLFLPALSPKLKIFLIKKNNKMPFKWRLHFYQTKLHRLVLTLTGEVSRHISWWRSLSGLLFKIAFSYLWTISIKSPHT